MKKLLVSFAALVMGATSLIAAPQAVVFDWGGVIGFSDRAVVVNFMCDSLHCSESEFESANLAKKRAMKEGKLEIDFWLEYAKGKGVQLPKDWAERYTATLKESVGADPTMYVLIDQLKENGIRVGMLSNIDDRYTKLIRDFGFYKPFDPCLLSCEMGLEKPDSKAYELLLKTIRLPAGEVVFIDDKAENVDAARRLGIDAIVFESEGQIRGELGKRGILRARHPVLNQ
jgi:epoxide hydrolase-like predicted phosphatase